MAPAAHSGTNEPRAKRVVKPLVRGLVKTSVGLVLEVERAAREASEGLQDLAAEVTAEVVAVQMGSGDGGREAEPDAPPVETSSADGHHKAPAERPPAVASGKAR